MPRQPKIRYPIQEEIQYQELLQSFVIVYFTQFNKDSKFFKSAVEEYNKVFLKDSFKSDGWADKINQKLNEYKKKFKKTKKEITEKVKPLFEKVSRKNKVQVESFFEKTVKKIPFVKDVWEKQVLKSVLDTNVNLITSLEDDIIKMMRFELEQGISTGKTWEEIKDKVLRKAKLEGLPASVRMKIENRVALIAQDQVQKANAIILKNRLLSRGIYGYQWQTMKDKKVRPTHRGLEGKYFLYPEAYNAGVTPLPYYRTYLPDDLFPGWGINCRCSAIPDTNWLKSRKFDSIDLDSIDNLEYKFDSIYYNFEAV